MSRTGRGNDERSTGEDGVIMNIDQFITEGQIASALLIIAIVKIPIAANRSILFIAQIIQNRSPKMQQGVLCKIKNQLQNFLSL